MEQRVLVDPQTGRRFVAYSRETDADALERHRSEKSRMYVDPRAQVASSSILPAEHTETVGHRIGLRRWVKLFACVAVVGFVLAIVGGTMTGSYGNPSPVGSWLAGLGGVGFTVGTLGLVCLTIFFVVRGFFRLMLAPMDTTAVPTASSASQWEEAERLAVSWMRAHGATDASITPPHHDFGIDAESARYVAQVKDWKANVGAPAVREIFGIAQSKGKGALVFARTGYTQDAIKFANEAGVSLFVETSRGQYRPASLTAARIASEGL
ncbi:restriction endonuclease [Agromyces soli]